MPISDLVSKLVSCDAVGTSADNHEPYFTCEFSMYLKKCAGLKREKITVIQGWRAVLAGFHISLALLSDEELLALTTLLVFQTEQQRMSFMN
jgi:hypothetical protein